MQKVEYKHGGGRMATGLVLILLQFISTDITSYVWSKALTNE